MKKQVFWITEIIFWGVLIVGLAMLGISRFMRHEASLEVINLAFDDTDGLIVGSPVKFLGVRVGYVSKLKLQKDSAIVRVVISKKGVKIPRGSVASVEFSGLAASKSLEIHPPKEKINHDITTQETIRIQNVLENQRNISQNIIDMSNNFNEVIKQNNVNQLKRLLKSQEIFHMANSALDDINHFEDEAQKKLDERAKKGRQDDKS